MKKRYLALLMVIVMLVAAFAGCNNNKKPNDDETKNPNDPSTPIEQILSVCLASEPDTIDPALNSSVDGATMVIHAFSGLVAWGQNSEGVLELYADCCKALPEGKVDPETGKVTYVFELKDGLKWSDGSDLTAEDFVYSWNRAVDPKTAADYYYMFDIIDSEVTYTENAEKNGLYDYDEATGEYVDAEPDDDEKYHGSYDKNVKLNVTASEDGKSLTVVINNECTYFYELLAFPTYMPVKKDIVEANPDGWATSPETYIGNGPYVMSEWVHDSKIVYKKNPNYHDAENVTLEEISFYLSDNTNTMLANFKTDTWKFIDDVPTDEISSLKEEYKDEFFVSGQLGTYYVIFNVNKDLLPESNTLTGAERETAQEEVRKALSLLFDRQYICDEIGQAGQIPASSFVAMGLTDADGKTQFYQVAGSSDDYSGYFDASDDAYEGNIASAIETLKKYYEYDETEKKFTNFPTIEYIYNTNDSHKAVAEYLQAALSTYGITLTITNQEWNTFLNTRKNGDYNIARNGWLADYNDPMSFLDMWMTNSGNNDAQLGRDANGKLNVYSVDLTDLGIDYKVENGTWAETYDYLVNLIKATTDTDKRYALMHKLEDILMDTGAICPLYFYTDIYMCDDSIEGFYASPLGYKYFMHATITK